MTGTARRVVPDGAHAAITTEHLEPTDEQRLVRLCRQGHQAVFAELVERRLCRTTLLSRTIFRMLDALQATLRVAWYWLRELFDDNAYTHYVADWQARHAGLDAAGEHRLLTEREFFSDWIERRYGSTSGRC